MAKTVKGVKLPPQVPINLNLERRIVVRDGRGLFKIVGLSYLFDPPVELTVNRKLCCFTGRNERAIMYQELTA